MTSNHSPANGLDLRVVTEVPLRQFTWWLLMVLLVTLFGYPGVVCITPMAWLLALRVGNLVAWRSKSGLHSQRLIESVCRRVAWIVARHVVRNYCPIYGSHSG